MWLQEDINKHNKKKILFLNKKNQLLELELKELNDKSNSIAIKKDFQIELQNLRNENLQNQEILKEELEQIEIKNGLLELQLKNVNKNNEINFENLKNIQDKLDYEEINNKCIIYERDKIIENLIFENNNLKNNTSDKVNDIQANYELAHYALLFTIVLEIAEFYQVIELLGLQDNKVAKMALGSAFDWFDLLVYGITWLLIISIESYRANLDKMSYRID